MQWNVDTCIMTIATTELFIILTDRQSELLHNDSASVTKFFACNFCFCTFCVLNVLFVLQSYVSVLKEVSGNWLEMFCEYQRLCVIPVTLTTKGWGRCFQKSNTNWLTYQLSGKYWRIHQLLPVLITIWAVFVNTQRMSWRNSKTKYALALV